MRKNENKPFAKFIRSKVGVTQDKFAEMIGVAPCTLSSWITGRTRPSAHYLQIIARCTGLELSEIDKMFDYDEENKQ